MFSKKKTKCRVCGYRFTPKRENVYTAEEPRSVRNSATRTQRKRRAKRNEEWYTMKYMGSKKQDRAAHRPDHSRIHRQERERRICRAVRGRRKCD